MIAGIPKGTSIPRTSLEVRNNSLAYVTELNDLESMEIDCGNTDYLNIPSQETLILILVSNLKHQTSNILKIIILYMQPKLYFRFFFFFYISLL